MTPEHLKMLRTACNSADDGEYLNYFGGIYRDGEEEYVPTDGHYCYADLQDEIKRATLPDGTCPFYSVYTGRDAEYNIDTDVYSKEFNNAYTHQNNPDGPREYDDFSMRWLKFCLGPDTPWKDVLPLVAVDLTYINGSGIIFSDVKPLPYPYLFNFLTALRLPFEYPRLVHLSYHLQDKYGVEPAASVAAACMVSNNYNYSAKAKPSWTLTSPYSGHIFLHGHKPVNYYRRFVQRKPKLDHRGTPYNNLWKSGDSNLQWEGEIKDIPALLALPEFNKEVK
jgi:hypothetical protein